MTSPPSATTLYSDTQKNMPKRNVKTRRKINKKGVKAVASTTTLLPRSELWELLMLLLLLLLLLPWGREEAGGAGVTGGGRRCSAWVAGDTLSSWFIILKISYNSSRSTNYAQQQRALD